MCGGVVYAARLGRLLRLLLALTLASLITPDSLSLECSVEIVGGFTLTREGQREVVVRWADHRF